MPERYLRNTLVKIRTSRRRFYFSRLLSGTFLQLSCFCDLDNHASRDTGAYMQIEPRRELWLTSRVKDRKRRQEWRDRQNRRKSRVQRGGSSFWVSRGRIHAERDDNNRGGFERLDDGSESQQRKDQGAGVHGNQSRAAAGKRAAAVARAKAATERDRESPENRVRATAQDHGAERRAAVHWQRKWRPPRVARWPRFVVVIEIAEADLDDYSPRHIFDFRRYAISTLNGCQFARG